MKKQVALPRKTIVGAGNLIGKPLNANEERLVLICGGKEAKCGGRKAKCRGYCPVGAAYRQTRKGR